MRPPTPLLCLTLLTVYPSDAHAIWRPSAVTSVSAGCSAARLDWIGSVGQEAYYIVKRHKDSEAYSNNTPAYVRPYVDDSPRDIFEASYDTFGGGEGWRLRNGYQDLGITGRAGGGYTYYVYSVSEDGDVSEANEERVDIAACGALVTHENIRVIMLDFSDFAILPPNAPPSPLNAGLSTQAVVRQGIVDRIMGKPLYARTAYARMSPSLKGMLEEYSEGTKTIDKVDVYFRRMPEPRSGYCKTVYGWGNYVYAGQTFTTTPWVDCSDGATKLFLHALANAAPTADSAGRPYTSTIYSVAGVLASLAVGIPGDDVYAALNFNFMDAQLWYDGEISKVMPGTTQTSLGLLRNATIMTSVNGYYQGLSILGHEFLHSDGGPGMFNPHAGLWSCVDGAEQAVLSPYLHEMYRDFPSAAGRVSCSVEAYGDEFDVMGSSGLGHPSRYKKARMGYTDAANIFTLPPLEKDAAGNDIPQTYTIELYQAEQPASGYCVMMRNGVCTAFSPAYQEIRIPLSSESFYTLEYRTGFGYNGDLGRSTLPASEQESIYWRDFAPIAREGVIPRIKLGSNNWAHNWTSIGESEAIDDTVGIALLNPLKQVNEQLVLRPRTGPWTNDLVPLHDTYRKVHVLPLSTYGDEGSSVRRMTLRITRP